MSTGHVLIIVQNLPVPLDRRVWLECQALAANGYEVSVICPKGPGNPAREVIKGVHIYRYRPAPDASGVVGFAIEFIYSWIRTALLSFTVWRRQPFRVIQACNPPDTYWLLARYWRRRGVRFVFDHHDLNPELFRSRFGEPVGPSRTRQYRILLWLEAMTYKTADHVIATNNSYRAVAIDRGKQRPDNVSVVRSGPDTRVMRPLYPPLDADAGPQVHTLAYLGVMGPQDNVDIVLQVMDELVNKRRRADVRALLMGFGDCFDDLQRQSRELGLSEVVTFTGRVAPPEIARNLSRSDIGLCPDLKTPLNNVSTMNKTMEYMSYALPSVAFDLVETRVSGGDSVLYVPSGDVLAFTNAVEKLLDDADLREELGLRARRRVAAELDWGPQALNYVRVFDAMFGRPPTPDGPRSTQPNSLDADGRPLDYVDLDDEAELRRFIRLRRRPDHLTHRAGDVS